jgi:hypothetical protein
LLVHLDRRKLRNQRGSSTRRLVRRVLIACLVIAGTIGVPATPAFAHGGGPDATNYLSTILSSGMDGLEWKMFGGDSLLELTNRSGDQVIIEGYDKEPYLRFTPGDGVFENIHSPATYYNSNRYANVELPPESDATLDPEWRRVADGDTYAWHDHRAHWMSPVPPSPVFNNPGDDQLIFDWVIPVYVESGGTTHIVQVVGELWWVAPVSWWPPVLVLSLVFLAVVAVAMVRTRPRGTDWPGLTRPVVVMIIGVVLLDIVAAIDDIAASPAGQSQNVSLIIGTSVASLIVFALSWHAWKGQPTGFAALAGAGFAIFVIFASDHGSELSSSQLLTVLPEWIRRWSVAANFAIVVPVVAVCVRAAVHYRGYLKEHPITFKKAVPEPAAR